MAQLVEYCNGFAVVFGSDLVILGCLKFEATQVAYTAEMVFDHLELTTGPYRMIEPKYS